MNDERLVTATRQGRTVPLRESGEYHSSDDYARVPFELAHNQEISDGAVRLYIHMVWRYGHRKQNPDENQNFERRKTMAQALGVTQRTITNRIKELERNNWIAVIMQKNSVKGYTSNFYHVFEVQKDCKAFKARISDLEDRRRTHQKNSVTIATKKAAQKKGQ